MPEVERISENKPIFQIPPFSNGEIAAKREKWPWNWEPTLGKSRVIYDFVHENKVRNGSPSLCLNWV